MVIRALVMIALLWALPARAEPPARVVSVNVCTDQLAMMLAAPGQLAAVSMLSRDPRYSVMAAEARRYAVTSGLAEEIFLMKPDLVVAGSFTTRATVDLLRRLGFEVIEFPPAGSFDDIRANILRMGRALGRERRAAALLADFEARLAALRRTPGANAPRVAMHYANSYTSGADTLMNEVAGAAGLRNLAAERDLRGMARMPLELIAVAQPDIVVRGRRFETPARAQETFDHPALLALARKAGGAVTDAAHTACGGPFTLRAVEALARARDALGDE